MEFNLLRIPMTPHQIDLISSSLIPRTVAPASVAVFGLLNVAAAAAAAAVVVSDIHSPRATMNHPDTAGVPRAPLVKDTAPSSLIRYV